MSHGPYYKFTAHEDFTRFMSGERDLEAWLRSTFKGVKELTSYDVDGDGYGPPFWSLEIEFGAYWHYIALTIVGSPWPWDGAKVKKSS